MHSRSRFPPSARAHASLCAWARQAQEREYALADMEIIEAAASESAAPASNDKAQKKAEEKAQRAREKAERKAEKDRLKAEDKARREQEAADKARAAEEDRARKEEAKALARASRSQSLSNPAAPAGGAPGRSSMEAARPASPMGSPKPGGRDRDRINSGGQIERSSTTASPRQGSPTPGRQSPYVRGDAGWGR